MLRLTFASLRARPLRALLTALSIVLGVAMISGTFVLTGQIDRAFSEIFDAANAKNDVVDRASHRQREQRRRLPAAVPGLGPDHGAEGAGRGRGDGRDRRARIARHVQERHAQARRSTGGAPPLVFSTSPPRFQSRDLRRRPRRARARRDRAARGHGRQGRRHDRHRGRSRDARRPQAPARRRHLQDRHRGVARRRARQLDPARRRAALVRLREPVHAGQPAGRARRLPRRAARSRARGRSAPATRCRRAPRRRRPTRRGSPISSTASSAPRCWRSAASPCSSAPS